MKKPNTKLFKKRILMGPAVIGLLLLFCMFSMIAIEVLPPGGGGGLDDDPDPLGGGDDWITIEGTIDVYDSGTPDTIGNPGEVDVTDDSGGGGTVTTMEFNDDCFEGLQIVPTPYYWYLCIQVDNGTGAAGDFTFFEGGDILFYNFDDDEWVGTFTWTDGIWNEGDPPLAALEEVYVPFPEGYHIRIWFQICNWDAGHPWDFPDVPGFMVMMIGGCCSNHYIDFEIPVGGA